MKLLWLDVETTGLDPSVDNLLEIAIEITDDRLRPQASGAWTIYQPASVLEHMSPIAREMHTKSGLLHEIGTGADLWAARAEIESRLSSFSGEKLILAGNSVHFDRSFLRVHIPNVLAHISHRHLDISSLRIALQIKDSHRANEIEAELGSYSHRAYADIKRSQTEYKLTMKALCGD